MISAARSDRSEKVEKKKKVWILGGGLGGLSAAWALTSDRAARARFEVHVFQMGWRLGGKGRTGRDPHDDYRVIEHGLHAFAGYYHNTFRMLRACADDEEIRKLFAPEQRVAFPVNVAGEREPVKTEVVAFDWPPFRSHAPNGEVRLPGNPDGEPNVATLIARLLVYLDRLTLFEPGGLPTTGERLARPLSGLAELQWRAVAGRSLDQLPSDLPDGRSAHVESMLSQAAQVAADQFERVDQSPHTRAQDQARSMKAIGQLARATLGELETMTDSDGAAFELKSALDEITPEQRRALWRTVTRVCLATVVGVLSMGADRKGLDCLNCLDFREFLQLHGASRATVQSGVVKGMYDYVFAYRDGDPERPTLAAGVAVRFMLLFFLDCDGGMQWHMTRGMGESVVLPLYEALKEQGVHFHYYREVCGLEMSQDGRRVVKVRLRHQIEHPPIPRPGEPDPYLGEYEVDGESLPYWPLRPRPQTLADARLDQPFELEAPSATSRFPEHEHTDFDYVVMAIPPAAHASWLPPALREEWEFLLAPEHNVETVSGQIWTPQPSARLPFILVGSDERAFPSLADMSHQLRFDRSGAKGLFFLVGQAMRVPGQSERQATRLAEASLDRFIVDNPFGLSDKLGFGAPGMRAHVQCNQQPSDLYVLSPPHLVNRRPRASFDQVDNLALAGDWVRTGLDFGCAESAVLSGLQAANKLRGVEAMPAVETYVPGGPVKRVTSSAGVTRVRRTAPGSPVFDFQSCTGYAFFAVIDDPHQFLQEAGLLDPRVSATHRFYHPRGLRFWLVHFHDVWNRTTGERLEDYVELSMAFLVDVHDLAGQATCRAWHLPALYLTNREAQRVGVDAFGLPKRLADVRLTGHGRQRCIHVQDQQDASAWLRLDIDDLMLQDADSPRIAIDGVTDRRDLNAIFNYDPSCVQLLSSSRGFQVVAPQLEAELGRRQMATSARVNLQVGPGAAPPFHWRYHFTSFVLKADFKMTLRLSDRVC